MSLTPSRLHGRLLSNRHDDDSSDPFFSSSPTISPQNHHHQQPRNRRQNTTTTTHKTRMKTILLAAIAAAMMGAFTIASSGLYKQPSVSIRTASSRSADDRGRDSEQQASPSTTPPVHGQQALGNPQADALVVAGPTIERAAEQEQHTLASDSTKKVWSR